MWIILDSCRQNNRQLWHPRHSCQLHKWFIVQCWSEIYRICTLSWDWDGCKRHRTKLNLIDISMEGVILCFNLRTLMTVSPSSCCRWMFSRWPQLHASLPLSPPGILLSLLFSCRLENSVDCLIPGLFNYAFWPDRFIVLNGKFTVNEGLEMMWKEAVVACFNVL
jgi:hypothetical protein